MRSIEYLVQLADPNTHLLHVTMSVPGQLVDELMEFVLPSWSPGSYLMREFARQVHGFRATAVANGTETPLASEKVTKNTWRAVVPANVRAECDRVDIQYNVVCQELSVRTPYVDNERGFFVGCNVFAFEKTLAGQPIGVRFELPHGWQAYTPKTDGFVGREFKAKNYDELADTAVALSPGQPKLATFDVLGKPHGFLVLGEGRLDLDRVIEETKNIIETTAAYFGSSLTYERYLFIQIMTADYRGGLEHHDSCALAYPSYRLRAREDYLDYLILIAHEYFHVWNIKGIHTDQLGPFDYDRENYTCDLWMGEGWTSYFQYRIALSAGVITEEEFLSMWQKRIDRYEQLPGRLVQSAEEASFDAWIKLYKPDGNSPNHTISYYLKGSLIAMALDLRIRAATSGQKGLEHVLAYLFANFSHPLPDEPYPGADTDGYPERTLDRQIEAAVGVNVDEIFAAHVSGLVPFNWPALLSPVGIEVDQEPADEKPQLGVEIRPDGRTLKVVYSGGAAETAGLQHGDEVVAVDGVKVTDLVDAFSGREAPSKVHVHYFRNAILRETEMQVRPPRLQTTLKWATEIEEATASAKQLWLQLPN